MLDNGQALSRAWGSVQAEDIGSGFRRANKEIAKQLIEKSASSSKTGQKMDALYRKIQMMENEDERQGRERHRFINGSSRFIFYVLRPPKIIKRRKVADSARPVNAQNTITNRQRIKFAVEIGANIDKTTKFFVDEILPKTEALVTSMTNIDEVMQQLTDDRAKLPMEFMKKKVTDAVFLRIIRFVSQQYDLTKAEQKLMLAEFIAKSRPPLF